MDVITVQTIEPHLLLSSTTLTNKSPTLNLGQVQCLKLKELSLLGQATLEDSTANIGYDLPYYT